MTALHVEKAPTQPTLVPVTLPRLRAVSTAQALDIPRLTPADVHAVPSTYDRVTTPARVVRSTSDASIVRLTQVWMGLKIATATAATVVGAMGLEMWLSM